MPYYVRAFCKSEIDPTLAAVEADLRRTAPMIRFETEDARDSSDWRNAELYYDDAKGPIVVEVNVDDGPESLVRSECQEFLDELGELECTDQIDGVTQHLRSTKYIVCCQLLGDIDDLGYEANGTLLKYFVRNHGGLIQADAEGFYDGEELIVEL